MFENLYLVLSVDIIYFHMIWWKEIKTVTDLPDSLILPRKLFHAVIIGIIEKRKIVYRQLKKIFIHSKSNHEKINFFFNDNNLVLQNQVDMLLKVSIKVEASKNFFLILTIHVRMISSQLWFIRRVQTVEKQI